MNERMISLPGGVTWIVRAYQYPGPDEARVVWEEIQGASRGKGRDFSIWRTMNREETIHLIVVCGRSEHLPVIEGGLPFDLSEEEARVFALRRARVGHEADIAGAERLETESRNPGGMVIDPRTGKVSPYRRRENR